MVDRYRGAVAIVEEKELPPWRFLSRAIGFLSVERNLEKKAMRKLKQNTFLKLFKSTASLSSKNVWYFWWFVEPTHLKNISQTYSQVGSWIPKDGGEHSFLSNHRWDKFYSYSSYICSPWFISMDLDLVQTIITRVCLKTKYSKYKKQTEFGTLW